MNVRKLKEWLMTLSVSGLAIAGIATIELFGASLFEPCPDRYKSMQLAKAHRPYLKAARRDADASVAKRLRSCDQLAFQITANQAAVDCALATSAEPDADQSCDDFNEVTTDFGSFIPDAEFQGICHFRPHTL